MVERAIEDGFVDCPKYGVMDEQRCLSSCEYQDSKSKERVVCRFGAKGRAGKASAEAAPKNTTATEETPVS